MYQWCIDDFNQIRVSMLARSANPLDNAFDSRIFDAMVIGREKVGYCITKGIFDSPYGNERYQIDKYQLATKTTEELIESHASRIAWFVNQHPTHKPFYPITIHVNHNSKLTFPWQVVVIDGRHRLAAAIYAKQYSIACFVTGNKDHVQLFLKEHQCE